MNSVKFSIVSGSIILIHRTKSEWTWGVEGGRECFWDFFGNDQNIK